MPFSGVHARSRVEVTLFVTVSAQTRARVADTIAVGRRPGEPYSEALSRGAHEATIPPAQAAGTQPGAGYTRGVIAA